MSQPPPPFSCKFSPNVPELLRKLNCTIAISTYQAGKVIFVSAQDDEKLVQLPRNFNKPMGIAVQDDKLGVVTKNEVIVLRNSQQLAAYYPKQQATYDNLFVPQATYYTGMVDIHDLEYGNKGLWAVVTSFSCLALINDDYSFEPKWRPDFITEYASEDRCHLNGMAMLNGEPKFVTAFGKGNERQSWRNTLPGAGILMDVDSNEIILENLSMPHSPRMFDNKLYVLLSATGELIAVDTENGKFEVVKKIGGFVRGMDRYKDYLFVGISRLRKNSSIFKDLEVANERQHAGIVILHLPTGSLVGEIKYETSVDEIYDVQVLPEMKRPGILNTQNEVYQQALLLPEATFWARKEENPSTS